MPKAPLKIAMFLLLLISHSLEIHTCTMMALKCILTDGYFLSCHKADGENPVNVWVKSAKNNHHSYEPAYKVRHWVLHRSRVSWQCGRQSVCRKHRSHCGFKGEFRLPFMNMHEGLALEFS